MTAVGASPARPARAKDDFSTVVYSLLAVAAATELLALFWLDLI